MKRLLAAAFVVAATAIPLAAQPPACPGTLTPNLSLCVPNHGVPNWDTWVNPNWTKLDSASSAANVVRTNVIPTQSIISPLTLPVLASATSPSFDVTNPAYGANAALNDNSIAVQKAISAAAAIGGSGGGTVFVPPGTYHFTGTLTGATNVTLQCESANGSAADTQPCTFVYDGTGATSFIAFAGKRGFHVKNISLANSSAGYTGCLADMSGSGSDTSMSSIEGSRIGGVGGVKTATGVCVGTSAATDTSLISNNLFVNLNKAIQFPTSGAQFNANNITVSWNYFSNNSFASVPNQVAGSSITYEHNTFEPSISSTSAAAIKFTSVGVAQFAFNHNWCGDGSLSDTTGVVIDGSALPNGQNSNIEAVGNTCGGFYSFYKGNSNSVIPWLWLKANSFTSCTGVVDKNGGTIYGDTSPNIAAGRCTYPVIDSSLGTNYPSVSQNGFYNTFSPNIGVGQYQFQNWGNLSPTQTQTGNAFNGISFGGFSFNPASRVWFNTLLLPADSISAPIDPDFAGNSGLLMWHQNGLKACAGVPDCIYIDTNHGIHFRELAATTSITFTATSSTATVVGPTTGLVNGVTYVISDPNVPAGTTGVYASSGQTLTLSNAATGTTTTGTPVSITSCTSLGNGQSTFANSGTNGLSTNQMVYVTGFGTNCNYLDGVFQVAYESLSSSAFNVFRVGSTVATRTDTGTATPIPYPSSLWVENGSIAMTQTPDVLNFTPMSTPQMRIVGTSTAQPPLYATLNQDGTIALIRRLNGTNNPSWALVYNDSSNTVVENIGGTNVPSHKYLNFGNAANEFDFAQNGFSWGSGVGTEIPSSSDVCLNNGTNCPSPVRGEVALVSGTATVSTSSACTVGSSCIYKLTNCGVNASSAIGVPAIGTISAGTNFVINSLSAANAVVTGDASTICWQIN